MIFLCTQQKIFSPSSSRDLFAGRRIIMKGNFMKKLILALSIISAGLFSSIQANDKLNVTVPCFAGGYTACLGGLYIRPSVPALDYVIFIPDFTDPGFHRTVRSVNPDYEWGLTASASYLLPGTGSDLVFTFASFSRTTFDDSSHLADGNELVAMLTDFDATQFTVPGVTSNVSANAKAHFNYQTYDLTLGQHLLVGCKTHFRIYGGVRYINLNQRLNANYFHELSIFGVGSSEELFLTSQRTNFKGIGPRLGIYSCYELGCGFGIVGDLATSLLIGESDSHFSQFATFLDGTTATIRFNNPDVDKIVANLTGRLGLAYIHPLNAYISYKIEAGYLVEHYYDTVYRYSAASTTLLGHATDQCFDTSFDGPYISVVVKI